jgi:predicted short-subunit dehydrogenase-like oxidoreductase (DUF2520 family)
MSTIRIIGPGRAGASFAAALRDAGHTVSGPIGRDGNVGAAARGVDALILAVPDDEIARVASLVEPDERCVVIHLSGSLGCDVLVPHPRRGAMHPLVPLPTPEVGAARLGSGVTMAVTGDALAAELAASLGARLVEVADTDRPRYHAAACIAANHVVALLGQVERIAASIGLDTEAFLGLTRAALDDVAALGPRAALTGPASRGDWATVARHLDALPASERAAYGAGVALALELAGTGLSLPATLASTAPVSAADATR